MTPTEFSQIVAKPNAINEKQTSALEKIVDEFPYFQAARALRLKGLYNENSFRYNYALKVTAAYTTDRSILFDFITSTTFSSVSEVLHDKKMADINQIEVVVNEVEVEDAQIDEVAPINSLKQSIITSIKEATFDSEPIAAIKTESIEVEVENLAISQKLKIGKPLEFAKTEKHSFEEWLQLSKFAPINRVSEANEPTADNTEHDIDRLKKKEIIDRFIQSNPKIQPIKSEQPVPVVQLIKEEDQSYLMTETLARVYLEQKKYAKAIQAYEILILKYPEKSSLFADRILDIKHLQKNNNIL